MAAQPGLLRARPGVGVAHRSSWPRCPRLPLRAQGARAGVAAAAAASSARRGPRSPLLAVSAAAAAGLSLRRRRRDSSTTTTAATSGSNSDTTQRTEDEEQRTALISLAACLAAGALLGALVGPADGALPPWAQLPSSMLGWSYTACWTVSFWPQVITNHRKGNVDGLSLDYLALSAVGFAAYTAYTASLYLNDGVRLAYEAAHGGAAVDVQLADVVFAVHALAVTGLTAAQALPEKARTEGQRLSPFAACACGGALALVGGVWLSVRHTCAAAASAAAAAAAAAAVAAGTAGGVGDSAALAILPEVAAVAAAAGGAAQAAQADCAPLLDVIYALGFVKLAATLIKYTPQVLTNHQRRSTDGWALEAVLLDLAGGILSLSQVGLDALARGDLSVVTGNPAKLGIGAISLAFDVVFLLQHYVLYRDDDLVKEVGGRAPSPSSSSSTTMAPALALARVPPRSPRPARAVAAAPPTTTTTSRRGGNGGSPMAARRARA